MCVGGAIVRLCVLVVYRFVSCSSWGALCALRCTEGADILIFPALITRVLLPFRQAEIKNSLFGRDVLP